MTTVTVDISGMHCGSCALLIDDALADLPGVAGSRTSVKDARSIIELDTELSSLDAVLAAITELGYPARREQ